VRFWANNEAMDASVFALVLLAAACHAGWNAAIKLGLEPFSVTALIAVSSGLLALPILPFVGLPPVAAWPWVAASVVLHIGYFIGLTEAYRTGDMGQVYPIARGTAPLMTAVVSALWLGESSGLAGWLGIALLGGGVMLLSLRGGRTRGLDRRSVGFALFTAITIAAYSIVDGVGARVSGDPHAYAVVLFIGNGIMMASMASMRRGQAIVREMTQYWKVAFTGGALSFASYWIAIWAMTVAPIAMVAALRETSVLFAAAIAVVFLKEPVRASRMVSAAMIVAGLAMIRLA
jgi:drug/metabolite transporter (DMT)-like permease